MDKITRTHFDNLSSPDADLRSRALSYMIEVTNKPVDWAYEVWDGLVAGLGHESNHQRAIAAQVLCNLARSDPEGRMLKDFDALLAVTKDQRFVTARHCMQAIWKVGAAAEKLQKIVVDGLAGRFGDCAAEKNCTLIRYDIILGLRKLYEAVKDEKIKERALELIDTEQDPKYRKKYMTVWRAK